jgi:aspartyl-tRNA(Asn)/glutamyl-tRNA(Gln) amidotransferase subunit C
MPDGNFDIRYVAHLARLALTPDEEARLGAQLGHILQYVEQLREVDVAGVEPTAHPFPVVNVTRPDEPVASLPHDEALRNAPATIHGLFRVPAILDQS